MIDSTVSLALFRKCSIRRINDGNLLQPWLSWNNFKIIIINSVNGIRLTHFIQQSSEESAVPFITHQNDLLWFIAIALIYTLQSSSYFNLYQLKRTTLSSSPNPSLLGHSSAYFGFFSLSTLSNLLYQPKMLDPLLFYYRPIIIHRPIFTCWMGFSTNAETGVHEYTKKVELPEGD